MSSNRKCSIITVSYNSAKTIETTIKSVLNQTYENIEYIIVDGGSSDSTLEIIKRYEDKFNGRMKWISEPDDGIYYAMNKGIDMATGDLIGIINSDDYYENDAVVNMMTALGDKEGNIILYGFLRTVRDGLEDTISIHTPTFIRDRSLNHPSTFVTKHLYTELGKYDTQYISASDYDFFLRMAEEKVEYIPVYETIANFSTGGMCSTSRAYFDLLKVKRDHNIISVKKYNKELFKCKLYDFFHGTIK